MRFFVMAVGAVIAGVIGATMGLSGWQVGWVVLPIAASWAVIDGADL